MVTQRSDHHLCYVTVNYPLSLCYPLIQQIAATLHLNKFSPWQGFINNIPHLFTFSFDIISCHTSLP